MLYVEPSSAQTDARLGSLQASAGAQGSLPVGRCLLQGSSGEAGASGAPCPLPREIQSLPRADGGSRGAERLMTGQWSQSGPALWPHQPRPQPRRPLPHAAPGCVRCPLPHGLPRLLQPSNHGESAPSGLGREVDGGPPAAPPILNPELAWDEGRAIPT